MAATSSVIVLLLASIVAGASAATFTITNSCSSTVWPAATPVGGGRELKPGESWTIAVPAGTASGRVWGRTGCSFNGGSGRCDTGDCAGALSCTLSGQPPMTLAEFTIGGAMDSYDISVIDGFNVGMAFSCSSGVGLVCRDAGCPDAYHQSGDRKTHTCGANSNYQVTFCP